MRFPGPVRAFVGLAATAAAEAKHLPDRAIEAPMLAISTVLQASLRVQQRYARLAARGDEILNHRPAPTTEAPPWARFDDDDAASSAQDGVAGALTDLFGTDDPTATEHDPEPLDEIPSADEPPTPAPARKTTAKKAAARKTVAKRTTSGKDVVAPRHVTPSAFDRADGSDPTQNTDATDATDG